MTGARRAKILSRLTPTSVLAVAMAGAGAYVVLLGSRLTFLLDDWRFVLERRGFDLDTFLRPSNEHLVAGHVAIWKPLLAIFGLGSTLPWFLVLTAVFLTLVGLFYVWVRRRIGAWPALFAALPILFLGAAFEDLLWFSSIAFIAAMACGLGMLVALDRRDRSGDRWACALLVGAMIFSGLWVAFAIGAAVDIAVRRAQRPLRSRAFVLLVPGVLFAIWWLGWGHTAENAVSFANAAATPRFMLDAIAAGIASLLGLAIPVATTDAPNGLDWGRPLAVALIGLAGWRAFWLPRVPRSFWVVLAIGLSFAALAGLEMKEGRAPSASRYQICTCVFILLVAVPLLQGLELGPRLLAPTIVVVGAAVLSNVVFLHQAYQSFHTTSQIERADLAAVEIARDTVSPGFLLDPEIAGTPYLQFEAGPYLSAREAFDSPAYSQAELTRAPEGARAAADRVLVGALDVQLGEPSGKRSRCEAMPIAGEAARELTPGEYLLEGDEGTIAAVKLRRFAAEAAAVDLGPGPQPGAQAGLLIPRDRSAQPWLLELEGKGQATLCGPTPVAG